MKRNRCGVALLLLGALLLPVLVSSAYSFFVYSDHSAGVSAGASGSNALFDETVSNDYYRVYFFASPYYATGATFGTATSGTTETDPLKIANRADNPYNSDDPYMMVGSALTGDNIRYANAKFQGENGYNYHYVSYKSKKYDLLTGAYDSFERFTKKDYTGYIRANEALGITQQTSTYVSITVQGNLSMEQLNGIVAATEFRDQYGFGPEFIGWTWNKAAAADRAMYGTDRYPVTANIKEGDTRGYGDRSAQQMGNFGCQGEIEQITSTTSLKAIDKTTADGSAADDRVIYLYPVFLAKNYSGKTVGGSMTSILKFRVNADTGVANNGKPNYIYQQSSEIDYSQNRYTVGLFQRVLNAERNNVNYYINNLYISSANTMQLDFAKVSGSSGWGSDWHTILSNEATTALGLQDGYYNVDVTLVELLGTELLDPKKLDALLAQYQNTEKYVAYYYQVDTSLNIYYIIGFQRVEEFHLVGTKLNGSLTDYDAPGYEILHTTTQMGDKVQYIVDRVYLYANTDITVLTSYADGSAILPYQLAPMDTTTGVIGGSTSFSGVGAGASPELSLIDNTRIRVQRSGNYSLIFSVIYNDGQPAVISVAYAELDHKYSFIVLNQMPDLQTLYIEKTSMDIYVHCEASFNAYLTEQTVLTDVVHSKTEATATISTIGALFDSLGANQRLVDTATGVALSRELFTDGRFCLNRNYIVYIKTVS